MKKIKFSQIISIISFIFLFVGTAFAAETSVLLNSNAKDVQVSGENYIFTTGDSYCTPEINGAFTLSYSRGMVYCGDVQYKLPLTITSQNPICINGNNYKGRIVLEENEGKLCIVNYLDTEDYLAGVLACEMSPKWPVEALKAQAVLARTYLLQTTGKRHGKYDICCTEHCQAYNGLPKDSGNITRALEETKDIVVCYNNQPMQVFFFADSGGVTASSSDVWDGEKIPYLTSRPDPDAISGKFATWKFRCNMTLLQEKLLAKGIDLGTIVSVTPTERDGSGRVKKLEIKGENGTKQISASQFRSMLGAKDIKSTLFRFAKADEGEATQPENPTSVNKPVAKSSYTKTSSKSGEKFQSKIDELMWLGDQGAYTTRELCAILVDFDNYDTYIAKGHEILKTGKKTKENTPDTTISNDLVVEEVSTPAEGNIKITNESASGNVFMVIGYGYGHGVGMPQNQCKYLAEAGWTYDQILSYYFSGTNLGRLEVK